MATLAGKISIDGDTMTGKVRAKIMSTAVRETVNHIRKHGADVLTGIRDAFTGVAWRPSIPAPA